MSKAKKYIFNPAFLPKDLQEFEKEKDRYLKQIKKLEPNLKTGDIVELKPYSGVRNMGKYIYNGVDIIPLSYEFDDYGHIPLLSQFEVVRNFHIKYWAEIGNIVYFNPRLLLTKLNQIYKHDETYYYLFKGLDGKLCGIFENRDTELPAENKQHFLNKLNLASYFTFCESENDIKGGYTGEGQLDPDHILLL